MRQLTPNFHEREFACKDALRGKTNPPFCNGSVGKGISQELVNGLQQVRDKVGKPILVTSGYRCPAYNASLSGAASQSKHMKGTAADIRVDGMTSEQLMKVVEELNLFTGRGLYPGQGFVHVDVRNGLHGSVTRWVKRINKPYQGVTSFKGLV